MNPSGKRFFAALLGVPTLAAPVLLLSANVAGLSHALSVAVEMLFYLSIPLGFALGWRFGALRGSRAWKILGMTSGVIFGCLFGFAMEGAEGAFWGGLAGLVAGFAYGLYAPWIADQFPARWGMKSAWACLGILFYLIPALAAIRLFFGKFDGDDIPFVLVAAFLGIRHATKRGWWEAGELRPDDVRAAVGSYLRRWLDPRMLVWALAFVVPGFAVGGCQNLYLELPGETFHIVLDPSSWWWPLCLLAASLVGALLSLRKRGLCNRAYMAVCTLVAISCAFTLAGHLRFHTSITDERLGIRRGLFQKLDVARPELARMETEVERGRRHVIPFTILVTSDGKRHSLRRHPHSAAIRDELRDRWGVAVLPPH